MWIIRYCYRVPWLLAHALAGVVIGIAFLNPVGRRLWFGAAPPEETFVPWWSRVFLRIFGVHVAPEGEPATGAALFAANHLSWIDIVVLHSRRQMAFVAKREIRSWPLVGWLASRAGTIYHRRGSNESLGRVGDAMTVVLRRGGAVALFPEGRVGDGARVLPFHARLFRCAIESGAPVQPVALRYRETDGSMNTSAPFRRREPFMANLLRLLAQKRTYAEVLFCPAIASAGSNRRALAEDSRAAVRRALGETETAEL